MTRASAVETSSSPSIYQAHQNNGFTSHHGLSEYITCCGLFDLASRSVPTSAPEVLRTLQSALCPTPSLYPCVFLAECHAGMVWVITATDPESATPGALRRTHLQEDCYCLTRTLENDGYIRIEPPEQRGCLESFLDCRLGSTACRRRSADQEKEKKTRHML